MLRSVFLSAALSLAVSASMANEFSIGTWNVATGTIENMAGRTDDLKLLGAEVRSKFKSLPNILVLQEVTSYAAAREIANGLGYRKATIATSDFGKDQEIWPFALEVAIITTKKVASVQAFQSVRKKKNGKIIANRPPFVQNQSSGKITQGRTEPLEIPKVGGIADKPVARGVLRVELGDGTVIYGVHLNSSGLGTCRAYLAVKDSRNLQRLAGALGLASHVSALIAAQKAVTKAVSEMPKEGVAATVEETLQRAASRESTAAAISMLAKTDVAAGKSVFVAGDFNTPLKEGCKTGVHLLSDHRPQVGCTRGFIDTSCKAKDGYDETIAILQKGLVGGPSFKVLTDGLGRTYVKSGFADSPIDNILVAGKAAASSFDVRKIEGTKVNDKVYGSDHFAVVAKMK